MAEGPARRRVNAPIRPRRPATTVPDLVFALAATGWGMALTLAVGSFAGDAVTEGSAGKVLARFFAAALAVAGLMLFLLGLVLLRDERGDGSHYRVPMLLGGLIGVAEAALIIRPEGTFLFVPLIFLVFALRPVRRAVGGIFGRREGAGR
ncbi:MAG: hypothetical protein ACKVT1_20275 [Dehalococcoidia bacterium]